MARGSAFFKPLLLSPELEAIVGEGPQTRPMLVKTLWHYIKANNLQNKNNKRYIDADAKLRVLFGGKESVDMFEMTKLISAFLGPPYVQLQITLTDGVAKVEFSVSDESGLIKTKRDLLATVSAYLPRDALSLSPQISALEDLISSKKTTEQDLQVFFEKHPAFLLGIEYAKLYPQVVLDSDDGKIIPDFFLEPVSSNLCDIVEIKKPIESLVVGRKNRRRFAAEVLEGVAQLREYGQFFDDPNRRNSILRQYGIKAYRPKLTLLIGRALPDEDELLLQRIKDEIPVTILTYRELLSISRHLSRKARELSMPPFSPA